MSFPFRSELVEENTTFGTQKAVWKARLSGKSVLEACDCFALEILSNLPNDKRVEQFCDYLLENCIDADSNFPLPVWSECTASSLRTIKACESFHSNFNALFYSAHPNIFVLVRGLFQNQPPIGWLKEYKIQEKNFI